MAIISFVLNVVGAGLWELFCKETVLLHIATHLVAAVFLNLDH